MCLRLCLTRNSTTDLDETVRQWDGRLDYGSAKRAETVYVCFVAANHRSNIFEAPPRLWSMDVISFSIPNSNWLPRYEYAKKLEMLAKSAMNLLYVIHS